MKKEISMRVTKDIDFLIVRHGKTEGNKTKKLIGCKIDEPLSIEGEEQLESKREMISQIISEYSDIVLYRSPMRRCKQTADILFECPEHIVVDDIKEMDFGIFEGCNHIELSGDEQFQKWIDSNCEDAIPDGEAKADFTARCMKGLAGIVAREESVNKEDNKNKHLVVIVAHGGTIMSVMSTLTGGGYYDFQVDNGEGYLVKIRVLDNGDNDISYNSICDWVRA